MMSLGRTLRVLVGLVHTACAGGRLVVGMSG